MSDLEASDADPAPDDLAAQLHWFADNSYGDSSPVYRAVVTAVAETDELLSIVRAAPPDARHPGVLLAAVKFLVAQHPDHPLAAHYAQQRVDGVAEAFQTFVAEHRADVADLMAVRRIQTNEIARTAVLAPVLREIQRRTGKPLAVIDVGTSAGLNLLVDQVQVDYGHRQLGPADSPVRLTCEALDAGPPSGPNLYIAWRVGLDREPINLANNDDRRWLEACIWPEHTERAQRLAAATALQALHPPLLVQGDAVDALPALIDDAPDDLMLVVMTSWTAVYLSGRQRGAFERAMTNTGRPIAWVSAEFPDIVRGIEASRPPRTDETDISKIGLVWFSADGQPDQRECFGWAHNHGAWVDWPPQ